MGSFTAAIRGCALHIACVVLLGFLASCGGGSQSAPMAAVAAQAAQVQGTSAAAALTPDQLMDWAESQYPGQFPSAGKQAGFLAPYTYRHYGATDNYLGVSTGSSDVAIYIYGTLTGWQMVRVAALADYTCTVLPQNCAQSPNIAVYGDSMVPFVALNLGVLVPDRDVFQGGVAAESSTLVSARQMADTDRHSWINVFWMGNFNWDDPVTVKRDIAASVASLPANARFVVLSVVNDAVAADYKGTAGYQSLIQLNSDLAATYPQNYIDIRTYLVNQYNPNSPQDVADFQHGVIPTSLRSDEGHLNNDGSVLTAKQILAFINAKGW